MHVRLRLTAAVHAEAVTGSGSGGRRLQDAGTGGPADAALAETVVMINNLIAEAYAGKKTADFQEVLTRWARIAFAAEGQFATLAGQLGAGEITPQAYQYVPANPL
jgi:hypothetical protein